MEKEVTGELKQNMALHGHKDFKIYQLDMNIFDTVENIMDLDIPDVQCADVPYINKKTLIKNSKKFYATKLLFHKVGILSDEKLLRRVRKSHINSFDELAELYNKSATYVSPYRVPIDYCGEKVIDGQTVVQFLDYGTEEQCIELYKRIQVFFRKVNLSKMITELSPSCYVHELMHMELESQKGIIDNYYDGELLSIFMELLYAYENQRLFKFTLSGRLSDMFNRFHSMSLYSTGQYDLIKDEDYDIVKYCSSAKYVLSSLKAIQLLDMYIKGNYSVKKEILIKIQSVIDGFKQLSDAMEELNVTYESSLDSDNTKRLLNKANSMVL